MDCVAFHCRAPVFLSAFFFFFLKSEFEFGLLAPNSGIKTCLSTEAVRFTFMCQDRKCAFFLIKQFNSGNSVISDVTDFTGQKQKLCNRTGQRVYTLGPVQTDFFSSSISWRTDEGLLN